MLMYFWKQMCSLRVAIGTLMSEAFVLIHGNRVKMT
jgi:hypothetical protein